MEVHRAQRQTYIRIPRNCFVWLFAVGLCFGEESYAVQANGFRRVGILFNIPEFKSQLRKELAAKGWIDGHNLVVEERYTGRQREQLLVLAKELVEKKPDVIVASSSPAARVVMAVTDVIPIIAVGDPVGDKLVTNPLQPEANVTGLISTEPPEVSGKRLELLKQAVPNINRLAVLVPTHIPSRIENLKHTQHAAKQLGIGIQPVMLQRPYNFKNVFSEMNNAHAVLILPWAMEIWQKQQMLHYAARIRLPVVYTRREFAARGGFMSYGPVPNHTSKRIASFVDKLLNGAKPADLPVERPLRHELVINLRRANSFGLKVAPELLLQADEVIR